LLVSPARLERTTSAVASPWEELGRGAEEGKEGLERGRGGWQRCSGRERVGALLRRKGGWLCCARARVR